MATKQCNRCNRIKSASDFYADKRNPSRLHSECIRCSLQRAAQRAKKKKEAKATPVVAKRPEHIAPPPYTPPFRDLPRRPEPYRR